MKLRYLYLSFVISITIFGCAQIGSLTGGEKDKEPPVYLHGKPEQKSLNFTGEKIILTFDEFFQLNNLNSVFISSPPFLEKPDFTLKRKSLVVNIKEKLHDTTTYTLWFGDAIEDYHERNPLKNFRFIFSTGNHLDTMEISGKIRNAYSLKGMKDLLVMLYHTYNDSTPIKEIPYYIAKTDSSGSFKLDYIKPGKYRIFALNDQDANLKFNLPNEQIAFLDSFIIPRVKTETKIDSLKAGTILHKTKTDTIGDTLRTDTVIISHTYIYSPADVKLFSFKEDKERQYVINAIREKRGKCKFEFNKPADSAQISGINFDLGKTDHFSEKEDSSKIRIIWIKDKDIFNTDTLKFKIEYVNLDSANNKVAIIDTFKLFFDILKDTKKGLVEYSDLKLEQDSFLNYILETKTPIKYLDTTKIELFRLLDTMVVDTKKQELLKSYRPEPRKLFFELKRPYINTFKIEALKVDTSLGWYSMKPSENKTFIECEIVDKKAYEKDTLKLVVHYDNRFFFDQLQAFYDTLSFPLFKQGLVDVKRPSIDTLILKFKKEVSEDTKIKVLNRDETQWYNIVKQDDKLKMIVKITNKDIIDKDTLLLTIRTKDYDNTIGEKIYFEYSKSVIYVHEKRKLKVYKRLERNKFYFVFSKALEKDVEIAPLNFAETKTWVNVKMNSTKDTIFYTITDNYISKIDTLELKVSYDVKMRDFTIGKQIDTINVVYKKQRRTEANKAQKNSSKQSGVKEQTKTNVSIKLPVFYNIEKDSVSERKYQLKYDWITGLEYVLKLDSNAIIDVYDDKSPKKEVKFKVRKKDFYGSITLNLSNVKRISDKDFYVSKTPLISDTTKIDSLSADSTQMTLVKTNEEIQDSILNSKLNSGQLIVYLFDKDQKLIETKYTNTDIQFSYMNLVPGTYSLKIIYDANENNKWDTGNYLKNRQPERVLIYFEDIILKANFEHVVDWKINTPK